MKYANLKADLYVVSCGLAWVWNGSKAAIGAEQPFEYKQRNNLAADVQQFGPDLGTVS
jgi:hypothetical protein